VEDDSPHYSPDGKRIAFGSTRGSARYGPGGQSEIWVCDSDGQNPIPLTSGGDPSNNPCWSPDGQQIAFDSYSGGQGDICVINAAGGKPRRLTRDPSDEVVPVWSQDGRWIVFGSTRGGTLQLWKIQAEGGPAEQLTRNGGFAPLKSRRDRFVYYIKEHEPGIWRVPEEGGEETLVLDTPTPEFGRFSAVTQKGVFYFNHKAGPRAIEFFDFESRRVTKVAEVGKPLQAWNSGLAVSPDGRWVLYSQIDQGGSDIMLVENFR
jgi:Tol biopolymer transport system component